MDPLKIYGLINALKLVEGREQADQDVISRITDELTNEVKWAAGTIGGWICNAINSIVNEFTYDDQAERENIEEIVHRLDYSALLEWGDKRLYSKMLEELDNEQGFMGESHKDFVEMLTEDPTIGKELKEYLDKVKEDISDDEF